ncbi:hypothetical protein ALQ89_02177 [Pseudomonas amygdali pv. tabaci]|uniref:Uncharacterized protein n=2 Tax=Pseudomonas amygdali TaxID=47877 RepID=A0AAX1VQ48_PSEAJ|nr:hypothetical protein ALO35_103198 [Pseudomonas amygdali pv. lachrymans]KPY78406.1 hypothetical protein ALO60_102529 [Pseudomonas amygdali pv. tabaci]RML77038.1 hypothetical protein ALQ89_02177 [Pseudomonas amygdali pv. tabaci]RMR82899.1 hypothetical protein ALP77_102419 [Pseudomonas amygdali pv. tabaci]
MLLLEFHRGEGIELAPVRQGFKEKSSITQAQPSQGFGSIKRMRLTRPKEQS